MVHAPFERDVGGYVGIISGFEGFPKYLFGGIYSKDYSIMGSILRTPPFLGKLLFKHRSMRRPEQSGK